MAIKFNMRLESLFQAGYAWQTQVLTTLKQNTVEFFQEETRDLPASAEVERFCAQLAQLGHDVQQLNERVAHLASTTNLPLKKIK